MGSKLKSLVLAGCSFPLVFRYAQAAHLTVSEKPGEPLSLYVIAGGGLALIFSGILFLLGVFLARGVKKGWGLIASGAALIIIGAIITAEREEGGGGDRPPPVFPAPHTAAGFFRPGGVPAAVLGLQDGPV